MSTLVYALCAPTSIACAVLLLRGYRSSQSRLLLWSGLCFAGLAANNVLLLVDKRMPPAVDRSLMRTLPALAASRCCSTDWCGRHAERDREWGALPAT